MAFIEPPPIWKFQTHPTVCTDGWMDGRLWVKLWCYREPPRPRFWRPNSIPSHIWHALLIQGEGEGGGKFPFFLPHSICLYLSLREWSLLLSSSSSGAASSNILTSTMNTPIWLCGRSTVGYRLTNFVALFLDWGEVLSSNNVSNLYSLMARFNCVPLQVSFTRPSGLIQSSGWPTVVAVMGNWFGKSSRGFVLGLW